jgi:hypothetical protein
MKIKLTETQYKRLLKESNDSKLGDTISKPIIRIMISLKNDYDVDFEGYLGIEKIKHDFNLNHSDATTLIHNYRQYFQNKSIEEFEQMLGKPLTKINEYVISVNLPAIVQARAFVDCEVIVRAGSPQEALDLAANGDYVSMVIDSGSRYNQNVDLDWDFDDVEILDDMSTDILNDFSNDWGENEINRFIKLKQ